MGQCLNAVTGHPEDHQKIVKTTTANTARTFADRSAADQLEVTLKPSANSLRSPDGKSNETAAMATLLYTIIGMTASASLNCAVRREISPCTCSPGLFANNIDVKCEQMESFGQVVNALQDRFTEDHNIWLTISHSQLLDLAALSFWEMNMNIKSLRINFDNLRVLRVPRPVESFPSEGKGLR
uniref:Uncharacterized protein n=4 Tax=Cellia TaxID=44534 RepID=A0A182WKN9_9DIPT